MWKVAGVTILLGAIGLFFALTVAGMFDKPDISVRELGPYTLLYKKVEGEYQQAGLYSGALKSKLIKLGIPVKLDIAMFFDDPRKTDEKQLRFIAGVTIESVESIDPETMKTLEGQYGIKTFPRQRCMVGVFPYRSKMTPIFGLSKVYPALDAYRQTEGLADHPVMEMTDVKEKQMVYIQPLEPETDLVGEYYLYQGAPPAESAAPSAP